MTSPCHRIKRLRSRLQPIEMAANVTHVLKNHPGCVLGLVLQTHNLFPETEQGVLMKETAAHPYGERITAIVPCIIRCTFHPMKRGENLISNPHRTKSRYETRYCSKNTYPVNMSIQRDVLCFLVLFASAILVIPARQPTMRNTIDG